MRKQMKEKMEHARRELRKEITRYAGMANMYAAEAEYNRSLGREERAEVYATNVHMALLRREKIEGMLAYLDDVELHITVMKHQGASA